MLKCWALVALALGSLSAYAYEDDKEKERCRNPKVQEFTLPEYSETNKKEAAAETDFSFVVSGWADPKKIKLDGKGIAIPFTVKSSETFHKVNAKLPPELTGQHVRINARIPAVLGCYTTIGWLVKVADKTSTATTEQNPPVQAGTPTPGATPTQPEAAPH